MNWTRLMAAGMRGLGLDPDRFWALTPAELALMLGAEPGAGPLTRDRLDALARAYPDTPRRQGETDD